MCTRFLFAVLPSELYWGDQTLRYMNTALADNLNKLFEEGVNATWSHKRNVSAFFASKSFFGYTCIPSALRLGATRYSSRYLESRETGHISERWGSQSMGCQETLCFCIPAGSGP